MAHRHSWAALYVEIDGDDRIVRIEHGNYRYTHRLDAEDARALAADLTQGVRARRWPPGADSM